MSYEKLVNSNYLYRPVFLNSWDEKDLYDLAIWRNGLAFKKTCFSEKGKPIIKIAELKNGLTEQTKYTNDFFDESVHLTKKDMVFSWSGNPETSIDVFWYDLPDGWLNQHIFKIMVKDGTDRNFFYYLLKYLKPNFTAIASNKQTTGLGHVTINDLKNIIVRQPDLNEQRTIASTLSCLDDMIELNNRTNQVLEEMAQAIFKHWFVDFEFPNEDGQPYKSSGGAMADSELGEMPAGWTVGTINDIAKDIVCGKTPPTKDKDNYGDYMPFITIPDMHNKVYVTKSERYLSHKGVNTQLKKTLLKNSICVSCIATPGLVCLTSEESQTNQQINSIICKDDTSCFYVYLSVCLLSEHIKMLGSSGSATNNLNKTQFSKINILIDNNEIQQQFHTIVEPIFKLIKENELETATLVFLRDTLLPKLMSGEIRIPVEEVV